MNDYLKASLFFEFTEVMIYLLLCYLVIPDKERGSGILFGRRFEFRFKRFKIIDLNLVD
jgi:hypothetical protein